MNRRNVGTLSDRVDVLEQKMARNNRAVHEKLHEARDSQRLAESKLALLRYRDTIRKQQAKINDLQSLVDKYEMREKLLRGRRHEQTT